jgi:ubiquinone biosynthesis protein Coq4
MINFIQKKWLHVCHNLIFHHQLGFGIYFLNLFGDRQSASRRLVALTDCPAGTLGHAIFQMMKKNYLDFVPWYESHDMKHALLGYQQKPPDEIRMQAFMFGNAGFSLFSVFTFLLFVLWAPDTWRDLLKHYRAGQYTRPIAHLILEDVAHQQLEDLRMEIGLYKAYEKAGIGGFWN